MRFHGQSPLWNGGFRHFDCVRRMTEDVSHTLSHSFISTVYITYGSLQLSGVRFTRHAVMFIFTNKQPFKINKSEFKGRGKYKCDVTTTNAHFRLFSDAISLSESVVEWRIPTF